MGARIENLVTSGTFSLDGGTWDVDNNVWIVGDDAEVFVIDPAHAPESIADAVGGRSVKAVLLTHGHDDHIRHARDFADRVQAPVYMNTADQMLWAHAAPAQRRVGRQGQAAQDQQRALAMARRGRQGDIGHRGRLRGAAGDQQIDPTFRQRRLALPGR